MQPEKIPSSHTQQQIQTDGFAIVDNIYSQKEIDTIAELISDADDSSLTFRKTNDLFAIRQFLKTVSTTIPHIFSRKLVDLVSQTFGDDYFVVKSIYFDKPENSNWFVAYHQDLTISVKEKLDVEGFGPWTVKQNQYAVQPPVDLLKDNFTLRIHLDDTSEENGALKVIPGSHLKGIYRPETIDWQNEKETFCNVKAGAVMIMKPLLLHASERTTNKKGRRIIHIEFSKENLPGGLSWSERLSLHNT